MSFPQNSNSETTPKYICDLILRKRNKINYVLICLFLLLHFLRYSKPVARSQKPHPSVILETIMQIKLSCAPQKSVLQLELFVRSK